jgi:hypothetical protein
MTSKNSLQNIFDKNRYDLSIVKKSKTWFDQQSLLLARQNITPEKVLASKGVNIRNNVLPGNLYMFMYDPKHKDTLPYYDRFPMVFPWKKTEGGFIGLNLHYLPYGLRIRLMDKLMIFKTNAKLDEKTRLQFSWNLINGVAKFAPAAPCVKQYLSDHVKSPFVKVNPSDWATAMMLPVERFVGANKQQVWQESVRSIL